MNCLAWQLIPMFKALGSFEFRDMVYQSKLADIFAIDCIVPTLKRNAVIPHMSVSVYGLVQFTIAVIAIQLELVGLHGIVFLSFMSFSRDLGAPIVR